MFSSSPSVKNSVQTDLKLHSVPIADTFAEAFPMVGARVIVTAVNEKWAEIAAREMSGYATSVIACDAEAGIERNLSPEETPDGRPGRSILVFSFGTKGLQKAVMNRVGQCILTCPTTSCFNGITTENSPTIKDDQLTVGGQLRFFGDGHQISKKLGDKRFWRVPVMEGEFLCEDKFGVFKGVAGGNILVAGTNASSVLEATEAAVDAIAKIEGVITPFPGGIVRSGSKVGSQYSTLKASTNDAFCPTLKPRSKPEIPHDVASVLEIVIDGCSFDDVQSAMKAGLHAACKHGGATFISAGNYGGKLGEHHFHLKDIL